MTLDKSLQRELKRIAAPRPQRASPTYDREPVYRVAHACFGCRRSFKLATDASVHPPEVRHCPGCGEQLRWMGRSFTAPRRTDVDQWKKVEILWSAGFRFHSYRSCPDAERLPETLAEVAEFLRRNPDHPLRSS